jgi:predicted nucleic-acid-binding protein
MIGLDTNVLVRHVIDDEDIDQCRVARNAVNSCTEAEPAFISLVVLAEMFWVLSRRYRVATSAILDIVERLLEASEILVEGEETVSRALRMARKGADFADALIADTADLFGCDRVVTFDKRAAGHKPFALLGDP